MVAAKARAPRASAFSERRPGCRARSGRRISEGGKIGRKKYGNSCGARENSPTL